MKRKKGVLFLGILPIIYLVLAIILLILLVWFGFRISEGLVAVFDFLKTWWWAIALSITGIMFAPQIRAIVNAILNKIGVKV